MHRVPWKVGLIVKPRWKLQFCERNCGSLLYFYQGTAPSILWRKPGLFKEVPFKGWHECGHFLHQQSTPTPKDGPTSWQGLWAPAPPKGQPKKIRDIPASRAHLVMVTLSAKAPFLKMIEQEEKETQTKLENPSSLLISHSRIHSPPSWLFLFSIVRMN